MGWTGFHPPNVCVQSLGTSLLTAVVFWTELPHTQQSEPIVMWGTTSEQPPPRLARAQGTRVMLVTMLPFTASSRHSVPPLGWSWWVLRMGHRQAGAHFFFSETTLRGAGLALPAVKHPVNGGCDSSVKWVAESNR